MKKSLLFFVAVIGLMAGCKTARLNGIDPPAIPNGEIPKIYNNEVVYIPQNDSKSCATTSVAMALSYMENRNNDPFQKEDIWNISNSSEKLVRTIGNDIYGLINICDYYGYSYSFVQNVSYDQLEHALANKILMVMFIKTNIAGTQSHAVLVTGYNSDKNILYINDPARGKIVRYIDDINVYWKTWVGKPFMKTNRAGLFIYPRNK
jgi:uncharacterized protein YvpB